MQFSETTSSKYNYNYILSGIARSLSTSLPAYHHNNIILHDVRDVKNTTKNAQVMWRCHKYIHINKNETSNTNNHNQQHTNNIVEFEIWMILLDDEDDI